MKEIVTTMTKRGQITVPAEVQRLLGIKPYDKVAFAIDEHEVRLQPARFTLESVFGSVEPLTATRDFKLIEHEAWDEKIERELRKPQQP